MAKPKVLDTFFGSQGFWYFFRSIREKNAQGKRLKSMIKNTVYLAILSVLVIGCGSEDAVYIVDYSNDIKKLVPDTQLLKDVQLQMDRISIEKGYVTLYLPNEIQPKPNAINHFEGLGPEHSYSGSDDFFISCYCAIDGPFDPLYEEYWGDIFEETINANYAGDKLDRLKALINGLPANNDLHLLRILIDPIEKEDEHRERLRYLAIQHMMGPEHMNAIVRGELEDSNGRTVFWVGYVHHWDRKNIIQYFVFEEGRRVARGLVFYHHINGQQVNMPTMMHLIFHGDTLPVQK